MYQTSQAFLEAMDDISRTLAVQVEIGGEIYPTDSIIEFELERGAFDGDVFTIGQTLSSALTLTIFTTSSVKLGDEVKLFTDLLVGDSYVRVPMGIYYVDSTSVNQEKMTLTCYDKMVSLVEEYIPSGDHKTLSALFNDVRTQIGMKYDGEFTDVAIKQPLYGYTYRETLGFIASLNGGNMTINRSGNLEIQGYQEVERHIPAKTCFSFDVKEGYHVSKVFCQFGDVGISRGDNTCQCVSFENPYVTEQNIDVIYNRLKGLRFTAGSLKYRGDLTLDPGDLFAFTDYKGDEYVLMCGRNKLTFNGGLSGQLESIGESENSNVYAEHQLKYKKNMTKVTAELGKIQAIVQEIEQSHDGLEERVKKAELEMTADAITSKIKDSFASKDEVETSITSLETEIRQTADEINLKVESKVDENSVVSAINMSSEAVKIKSDRIELTGDTVIISNGESKTLDEYLTEEFNMTQEEILETLDKEGNGLYLLGGKLYLNANAIKTGYLSASRIKAGLLQSTNGRLRFSLDGAYISVYDDYGDKVGQTVSNTFTDTTTGATMDGMSSGAEYGNYCALGAKTSSTDTAYTTMIMVSGADNSSIGSNLGGLKKGVNIWNPLTCAWQATFNSNLYANAHAYMKGISNTGYITTTTYLTAGSYIKAGTHMTTPKLSGVTDSSDSRARIEMGADINFKKNSRVQNPSFIEWQGDTCFTASGRTGDYYRFYPADYSGTNETNLYLQLANDYVSKFKITCNHWNKGHKSIAEFCYHEGTSTTTAGIDFWRSLSMNGYAIRACAAVSTSSVETANLTLIDDNAQVKVASPAATLSTLDHLEGADLTLTNYLPTATHKSVLHSGSVNVGADRMEWVDLPRQFLMCVDIQITATPNQLCRYAITHKDEYGFVIECDEPHVTLDYMVVGTKMDGGVYTDETNPLHFEPVDKSEPLPGDELAQEIVEDEVGVPIVVPTPQDM